MFDITKLFCAENSYYSTLLFSLKIFGSICKAKEQWREQVNI